MARQVSRPAPGFPGFFPPHFGGGGSAPAPAPVYYQPPQTTDPSVIAAQNAAAAAQQALRGRGATLIVDRAASGPDLLPSPARGGGGASLLGG